MDVENIWAVRGPHAFVTARFTLTKEGFTQMINNVLEHPVEIKSYPEYTSYRSILPHTVGKVLTPNGFRFTRFVEIRVDTGSDHKVIDAFPFLLGYQTEPF